MTIPEAVAAYGTKVYRASAQDTILTVLDRIYGSRDDIYSLILTRINNRYDWDNLEAGVEIHYISKQYCSEVYEVTN